MKTNLIDYLENNISVRIPQSKKEQERLDELEAKAEAGKRDARKGNDGPEEEVKEAAQKSAEIADFAAHKKKEMEKKLAPEEVEELEGLLMELWKFY